MPLDVSMYPMPVVLVGAMVAGRPNFLAVAWVSRVNYEPPMLGIALGRGHYTNPGIEESGAFSVNVPGVELVHKVDFARWFPGASVTRAACLSSSMGNAPARP
ncbi:MAG: flavin reductase family protein [Candidatus Oleimicrobiaceae bacterium]